MEKHDTSSEPMDIDLSGRSMIDMDISYNSDVVFSNSSRRSSAISMSSSNENQPVQEAAPLKPTIIKHCHINIKRQSKSWRNSVLKITIAMLVALVSITFYHSLKCCNHWELKTLNDGLSNKLFGQLTTARVLIETLKLEESSKLIFFTGGTGVGKTFVSSLLLDGLGPCTSVFHYSMPTFENTFSSDLMFGLTLCKMSVVVVDDMNINDDNDYIREQIRHLIDKSEYLNKEIIVILIYNCNQNLYTKESIAKCDELFNTKLLEYYSEIHAFKRIIAFGSLSVDNLKQCIDQELGDRRLNNLQLEAVLKNFNVSVDGCKGVHSKIKYLSQS